MVVTRESGSGTRSAFLDLFELQEINGGQKNILLTREAVTVNRSGSLLAAVAGNPYAIGYASMQDHLLGVKGISIDHVAPTREHIKDGSYPYARPLFMAVRKGERNGAGKRFLEYVLSEDGQKIVGAAGYLSVWQEERDGKDRKQGNRQSQIQGKLILSGSSTVMPLAEKWAEGYVEWSLGRGQQIGQTQGEAQAWEIELQESDSSSGIAMLLQGSADVALLSRELTREERQQVIWAAVAVDGLVIVVNEQNPIENLSKKEIRRIFMGVDRVWTE